MDVHLERRLRLHTEPEHEGLGNWAITEIDAQGQQVGLNQVPWRWTLCFIATSCVLYDITTIESQVESKETTLSPLENAHRQVIRLLLRPRRSRNDGDFHRETIFSMFGTDRVIKSFQLDIHPIADPAGMESCTAWGTVSYEAEFDYSYETIEDSIIFTFLIKPETFSRYATKISQGLADEIIFSVGSVAGFYSKRSHTISTDNVKVLTKGKQQRIIFPPSLRIEPPRLGDVGEAELCINRTLEFGKHAPDCEGVEETADHQAIQTVPEMQAPAVETRTWRIPQSLYRDAWSVVIILALIVTLLSNLGA